MEKFTPLAKIYTAAGTDGTDKFHLWHLHTHFNLVFVITSCDVCTNHWDAVVHMETFDSDTQVGRMLTK